MNHDERAFTYIVNEIVTQCTHDLILDPRIVGMMGARDRLQPRPHLLTATLQLAQQAAAALPAWHADVTLVGPLAEPVLQATLRAAAGPGTAAAGTGGVQHPEQSLDARAVLRPFEPWPLGELQASTRALDLSALSSAAWPRAPSSARHAAITR